MRDIFGYRLQLKDVIAFNPPLYKGLTQGIILGFTDKRVKVQYAPLGRKVSNIICYVDPKSTVKKERVM